MEATEHAMKSLDGAELFYRAWIPSQATDKAVLLFHRGHEHSGRWQETIDLLGLQDIAVFAWDARGHGRSPGERGAASSNDSGYSCISREALRSLRRSASANEAKTVRPESGEELRQIEAPDSRSGAGCAVRRRPAHLPANCGQCLT